MVTEITDRQFLQTYTYKRIEFGHVPTQSEIDAIVKPYYDELALYYEYLTGKRPFAVRINSGARKGSILKFKPIDAGPLNIEVDVRIPTRWCSTTRTNVEEPNDRSINVSRSGGYPDTILYTDEGKVFKDAFAADSTILLDYDGPTVNIYTQVKRGPKPEKPKSFFDEFGRIVEEGDFVIYTDNKLGYMIMAKFLGFKAAKTVRFIATKNGKQFTKLIGDFDTIKFEMDETSRTTLLMTDDPFCISDMTAKTEMSLKIISEQEEVCDGQS